MSFLDFINYDILLRVLKHVLSISAGIGLYLFVQRLLMHNQCDNKGNKKPQKVSLDKPQKVSLDKKNDEEAKYKLPKSYENW